MKLPLVRAEFEEAIQTHQETFGLDVSAAVSRLADHYEFVLKHNELLHLVAPCSAEVFATRHVLESLSLLKHLPTGTCFTDVGSGGGFPAIPCLIVRPDLRARLIESKEKKAEFLAAALSRSRLTGQAEVVNKQFAETEPGDSAFITCRALDKFSERLGRLIRWSNGRTLLFFGGEQLGRQLRRSGFTTISELMPLSDRRYLFVSTKTAKAGPVEID